MSVTQITHHDLDGYGAAVVVARFVDVDRCIHVPRYVDVGPLVQGELKRLGGVAEAEMLILTDLGLEPDTVKFLKSFAAMNRRREEGARHRLLVLDHHASSLDRLREGGLLPVDAQASPRRFDLGDAGIHVLIDETQCATRMAFEHRDLFATRAGAEYGGELTSLVGAIDAVDLWRKDRPEFRSGLALDEVFWDNVATLIPVGHPWHDRFVGALLLGVAALLDGGASPARVEREVAALRIGLLDELLGDDPEDDRTLTTRMRLAPVLARSRALFRPLTDGTLMSFGLDAGTFQRVSDAIMDRGEATRVLNVQRTGSMSFRSNNETALEGARKFHGGGHKDAAGGKLPSGSAFSLADAAGQVEPILNPPPPDPSQSPFARLQNWKG